MQAAVCVWERESVQGWTGSSSFIIIHSDQSPLSTEASSHATVPPEQEQANIKQENYPIIRKTLLFYPFVGM